MSFGNKTSTLL